jgi:hypothetical protein
MVYTQNNMPLRTKLVAYRVHHEEGSTLYFLNTGNHDRLQELLNYLNENDIQPDTIEEAGIVWYKENN